MKVSISHIGFFIALLMLYSCTKEDSFYNTDYPFVLINEVSNISDQGADFNASVLNLGNYEILDYGFVWNELVSNPTLSNEHISLGNKLDVGEIHYRMNHALGNGIMYSVRAYVKTNKYTVYSNITNFVSKGSKAPKIVSFTPLQGGGGTIVKITGEYFIASADKIIVKFGEITVPLISATETEIYVKAPQTLTSDSVKISVEISKMLAVSDNDFYLYYPWTRKNNFDLFENSYLSESANFTVQNKAYLICANSYILYVYDSELDTWSNNIRLPAKSGTKPFAFTLNGIGYLLIQNSLWQFDASTNSWIAKKKFPGSFSTLSYSFSVGNNAYVSDFYSTIKLWQYNPISDSWIEKNSCPSVSNFSFSVNNRAYIGACPNGWDYQFWEYNPETDEWLRKSNYPTHTFDNMCSFVIDNKAYLGLGDLLNGDYGGCSKEIWEYDTTNDSWIKYKDCPKTFAALTSFAINDKAYIFGFNTYWHTDKTKYMYEFNPSRN